MMTAAPRITDPADDGLLATIRELLHRDPFAFNRALSIIREEGKRRATIQCRGCDATVQSAHVLQIYCSGRCQRHHKAMLRRQAKDEARAAMRGKLYRMPDYPHNW